MVKGICFRYDAFAIVIRPLSTRLYCCPHDTDSFCGDIGSQGMGIWIWGQQLKAEERLRISEVSVNMGARIGQTIQFFSRLPREYRHIVLDQLRDMGGTRFFVSINSQSIPLKTVSETLQSRRFARP